jgi:transcription termination factor Rho
MNEDKFGFLRKATTSTTRKNIILSWHAVTKSHENRGNDIGGRREVPH